MDGNMPTWIGIALAFVAIVCFLAWQLERDEHEIDRGLFRLAIATLQRSEAEVRELKGALAERDKIIDMLRQNRPIRMPLLLHDEDGGIEAIWPNDIHVDDNS